MHDRLGMEAIRSLHQQLDDDENGNIDLTESDDVSIEVHNLFFCCRTVRHQQSITDIRRILSSVIRLHTFRSLCLRSLSVDIEWQSSFK